MKRFLIFLFFIFSFGVLNAQNTYQFRTHHPQGFTIESSTTTGLSLHYSVNEIAIADINNGEVQGQEIALKGSFGSFAAGLPNLPFENRYIAMPKGATVSVAIKENGNEIFQDINLLPAAEVMENTAIKLPKLHKDMNVFGKDANFPAENVSIAQTTQIRGLDVVLLNVTPFRYNPVRKTLEVIYDMDIDIRFEEGSGQFGDSRYRNPAWDGILRDLILNSDMLPEAHYYERLNDAIRNGEEGCEYLIIIPDETAFVAWADTLKRFRMRQGILTQVVTTTECGGNEPDDIRNYILNAYENWAIPPAAVLLFGENHKGAPEFGLKPFTFTSPPSYGHVYIYASDNPFADMNGDSIPDLAISRLVTKYPSECQQQVEKLIEYELNPPTDPHYYDHPVITSGYQEDKWFMITSQSVNGFFCNKLGKHTTNNYMVFDQQNPDPTPPDSIWSTGYNTSAVIDYFGPNGTQYIPSSIGYLDKWDNMTDIQPLVDAMNEGGFLTFHRDHSSEDLWCCPWFEGRHINLLQNKEPTFIFSIGCLNNNFWDNWTTCLSETFLNAEPGAIGAIGANSVTFSHYNDLITWGMFDYFWPDFMPTLGCQAEPEFSYPSYALAVGKLFLRQQTFLPYTSDTVKVEKTLNVFSYLGETYLNLYTEVPQPLSVDAPFYHADDQWQYTFTAEEDATVCLSQNDEIIQVVKATGQPQNITIPQMEVGEQFTITATKQNRFRFKQSVTVISATQPYVYLSDFRLNDQNNDGQFDYGEYAEIDIILQNVSPIASEGGMVTLMCDSPHVETLQGTTRYPQIASDSVLTIEKAFRVKLANHVPDQTDLRFYAHLTEGEQTYDNPFCITANAPLIQIDPDFRLLTADGEPSTHIATEEESLITFSINNIGHSPAKYLSADLNIKAPFVSVETSPQQESLEPNGQSDFTFELATNPNEISGAWLQSRLNVQYGEYHAYLDTIIQYGGIFEDFETDTLNEQFDWYNSSHRWVYCDEDAYKGERCFITEADPLRQSRLVGRFKTPSITHKAKISFRYKTDAEEQLNFKHLSYDLFLSSTEWQYAEINSENTGNIFSFIYAPNNANSTQAKIDDICFPPAHTTIAYAGDDVIACSEAPITLYNAYAYDCETLLWETFGDGHFDYDTIANPLYHPGSQDLAEGTVSLTLTAFGRDTIVSTTQIHFVDEINLSAIMGDSVVNKYSNPVSHYSVEEQEGINYLWQIEPAGVGFIYEHGHEIDILWNLNESDAEVTLSVIADNGCAVEPVTKRISLIGYSAPEWHSIDFELFPNPTDGKTNLVIGETLQGKTVVEVYNLLGERMMTKKLSRLQKGETLTLDLNNLISGLYIIKLSTENGSCTKKVSIK